MIKFDSNFGESGCITFARLSLDYANLLARAKFARSRYDRAKRLNLLIFAALLDF